MDDIGKAREELLGEMEELRRQLAAAERDHQIIVAGLREEYRWAEAAWLRQVEDLEAKLAGHSPEAHSPRSRPHEEMDLEGDDSERQRLLATIQSQTDELQASHEELNVQAEELQAGNEELTIQAEELRIANEELTAQAELLGEQKQDLEHLAGELKAERALLTSVLEQMPASVVIVAAPAGPILLSNHLAKKVWDEPLQGLADLDIYWRMPRYYPDGRAYRKEDIPLWRSLHLGEVVIDEEMTLRPKGRPPVHLSVSSAPVRDTEGRIVAGVVTHFDITERKAAEAQIRRLASFPQLNPNPVLELDFTGAITYYNQAAHAVLQSLGEAAGPEAFFPDDLEDILIAGREHGERRFYREVRLKDAVYAEDISYAEPFQVMRIYARDITERQQAEKALLESREDLNRAQAVAHTGSWRLNVRRNELTWSDETYRIFGIPQGTVLTYEAFLATVHPEDKDYVERKWTEALSGEPYDIEHRIVVGGTVKWVREKAELEFDPQGQLLGGFGTVQDITAHTQAEEALRESEERYRTLVELAPEAILVFAEGKYVFANQAAANLFGATAPAQMVGQDVLALTPPDFREFVQRRINEVLAGDRENQQEAKILRLDGQSVGVEATAQAIGYQGQKAILIIFKDITGRKQAGEAIIQAKEEWERTFDAVPDFIALLDKEHRITRINRAMAELLGKTQEEVIGQPCYKTVHGLDETPAFCPHSQVVATGREYSTEVTEFGRIFAVSVSPIFGPDGQLLGGVHVARDITARKEMEAALHRSHDELEQRVKERTEELRDTVAQLIEEVQERQLAEESLRKQAELLDLAHEAIVVQDLASRLTFWNRGAEEIYGWTSEQATGQVTTTLLKTQFPLSWEEIEQKLLSTGHWEGELVHTRANGEEIVVASRMAVQRNDAGEPVAILQINRDITARKRAEEALEAERQRFYSVLERIPAYVALISPNCTIPYANREFIKRFGDPENRLCYEFLFGLDAPCEGCKALQVFETNTPALWEWAGPDGNTYQISDYPFTDVDGSPLVLEMGIDISARKQAEEQTKSLGRMYRMLSKVNEAIVRVSGKEELFRQICRIMMEEGDFLLAWIGMVDRETRLVKAATKYDLDEYVQNITIPLDDVPEGQGPTGIAAREGRYDVCNDIAGDPRMAPWREQALARGFRSSAAFPLRVGSAVVGALTVYAKRPGYFTAEEIGLLESLAGDLSFALEFQARDAQRRVMEEVMRESEERLRHLASQLLLAQENERRRLALELHDDLGQSLMVLKLQLRAIEKTVPPEQWRTREESAHCLAYLNAVVENVRRLARNLRPSVLEDLGLSAGLRVLAEEFRKYHEVELSLEMDDIEGLFSRDEEINLYRIFQETLTNIAKHAQANQVRLVINRRDNGVSFKVTDDGVGFDLEQVSVRDPATKGLGLAALEERVRILGGLLTIKAQENLGTEVSFTVPYTGR